MIDIRRMLSRLLRLVEFVRFLRFFFLGSGFKNTVYQECAECDSRNDEERPVAGFGFYHEIIDRKDTARRQYGEEREYAEILHAAAFYAQAVELRRSRRVFNQYEKKQHRQRRKTKRQHLFYHIHAFDGIGRRKRRRNNCIEITVFREEVQDCRRCRKLYYVAEEIHKQTARAFFLFHRTHTAADVEKAHRAADQAAEEMYEQPHAKQNVRPRSQFRRPYGKQYVYKEMEIDNRRKRTGIDLAHLFHCPHISVVTVYVSRAPSCQPTHFAKASEHVDKDGEEYKCVQRSDNRSKPIRFIRNSLIGFPERPNPKFRAVGKRKRRQTRKRRQGDRSQ